MELFLLLRFYLLNFLLGTIYDANYEVNRMLEVLQKFGLRRSCSLQLLCI